MNPDPVNDPTRAMAVTPTETIIEKLEQLYRMDATVHAMRQLMVAKQWSETEMLRRLVVQLAHEKRQYFDQCIRLAETRPL